MWPAQALACTTEHLVVRGDTLSKLSRQIYGTVDGAEQLYRLNSDIIGPNPDLLRIGLRLTLPCGPGELATPLAALDAAPGDAGDTRGQWSTPDAWTPLVDVDRLASMQRAGTVQILDIRPAERAAEGVVAGAMSIPFGAWRGPAENPGAVPSDAALSALIGGAGLRLDRPVVIVHSRPHPFDTGRAAYVYWILKSLGAQRLAILEGGFAAWNDAGLPLAERPVAPRPYRAELTLARTWYADGSEVAGIADGTIAGALIDARPASVVSKRSTGGQSIATTLPGARNVSAPSAYKSLVGGASTLDGVYDMLDQLKAAPVDWERDPVVSFCETGELGALNWFYASEVAGIANVKLYPDSVRGWTSEGRALSAPAD